MFKKVDINQSRPRSSRGSWVVAIILLGILACIQLNSAVHESATSDEAVHLSAGMSYWSTSDYRMNPEHPPLVKLIAALPSLIAGVHIPLDDPSWATADKWRFGTVFLYDNSFKPETILMLGRSAVIMMSVGFGTLIYAWTRRRFGILPALLMLGLYVFDPMVQASGHYITTDLAAMFALAIVAILLLRYVENPSSRSLWIFAIGLAIAQNTKYSMVILWVAVLVVLIFFHLKERRGASSVRIWTWRRIAGALGICLACFTVFTFVIYGFEVKRPLDDPVVKQLYIKRAQFINSSEYEKLLPTDKKFLGYFDLSAVSGQRIERLFDSVPIPVYSYISGAFAVAGHNLTGHTHSLLNRVSVSGVWYYWPVAWFAKTPAGILILTLIGAVLAIRRKLYHRTLVQVFGLIAIVYFVSAMMSNITIGLRHLMPIFPMLYGLAAYAVVSGWRARRLIWRLGVLVLLGAGLFLPLRNVLHPITYYSELIGGTRNGYLFVLDSNLDWGQSAGEASKYIQSHGLKLTGASLAMTDDLGYYGFPTTPVPTSDVVNSNGIQPGWYLISINALYGEQDYDWLKPRTPDRVFGHALYLYRVN